MFPFILVARDNSYHLIGPFDSDDARRAFVEKYWDEARGDPRWQALSLEPRGIVPRLFDPAMIGEENGKTLVKLMDII